MKQVISTNVPVEIVGEAPVVKEGAILVTNMDELEVEALPTDIPDSIQVDVSVLTEPGQFILVSDLKLDKSVTVLTPSDTVVVSAQESTQEEVSETTTDDVEVETKPE